MDIKFEPTRCEICDEKPEVLISCVEYSEHGREYKRLLCRKCVFGYADTPSRVILKYIPNGHSLGSL